MNFTPGKTAFTDAEHAALRAEARRAITDENLSQAEVARQADMSAAVLSEYLKDKYAGDNNTPATALHKWVEGRKRAAEIRTRLPVAPTYQPLHTSKRIMALLDYSREMGRIVMIAGAPGVSKTATATQYKNDNNRAWLAAMDPGTSGVPTMLLEILAAMGESDAKGTPQQLAKRVVAKAVEAKGIIMVDEAQHLSDKAIEQLRAINDKTRAMGSGIGIALIGNDGAYSKVGTAGTKAQFAQVSSRFAQRRFYAAPDPKDVIGVAQAWADANDEQIGKAEFDFLQLIAAKPGGLRNVEMTFESALVSARGQSAPLTVEHLRGAFAGLSGSQRAA